MFLLCFDVVVFLILRLFLWISGTYLFGAYLDLCVSHIRLMSWFCSKSNSENSACWCYLLMLLIVTVSRDGYRPFGSLTVLRAVNEEKALEK